VRECSLAGKVLLEIVGEGQPAPYMSGPPFHRCTHTALSPQGDIYISDGYGNAVVHRYSPDGRRILSWGRSGTEPGEFSLPHNVCCDADGWVYVAERENHRIQIFDGNGRFETEWTNIHRPCAMMLAPGACPLCYVGEMGPPAPASWAKAPNLGPRISIMTLEGRRIATLGETDPMTEPKLFRGPHGQAAKSRGDLYLADVGSAFWPEYNPGYPKPASATGIHKLRKL
jgi:hypothetical protein